jgi:uncharacterized protein (UPF0332 family)
MKMEDTDIWAADLRDVPTDKIYRNVLVGARAADLRDVSRRGAVSAAYYALFHHINGKAVDLIAPNVQSETNHRIQRWFEHAEMKKVCGRFLQTKLDQPLLGLIGPTASSELQDVASSFIKLQDERHSADYDLSYSLSSEEAHRLIRRAVTAVASWDVVANSAEANIFILSLLMRKNWEKGSL